MSEEQEKVQKFICQETRRGEERRREERRGEDYTRPTRVSSNAVKAGSAKRLHLDALDLLLEDEVHRQWLSWLGIVAVGNIFT